MIGMTIASKPTVSLSGFSPKADAEPRASTVFPHADALMHAETAFARVSIFDPIVQTFRIDFRNRVASHIAIRVQPPIQSNWIALRISPCSWVITVSEVVVV